MKYFALIALSFFVANVHASSSLKLSSCLAKTEISKSVKDTTVSNDTRFCMGQVSVASNELEVSNLLKKVSALNESDYLLIYKKNPTDTIWYVNNTPENYKAVLKSYNPKKIFFTEGNVIVGEKRYYDKKHMVLLQ